MNRNTHTTLYRQLDAPSGRWLSVDPKAAAQPSESPYIAMGANPILKTDPLEAISNQNLVHICLT